LSGLFRFFGGLKTGFPVLGNGSVTLGILRQRRNAKQKQENAKANKLQRFVFCHLAIITPDTLQKYAKKQAKISNNQQMSDGWMLLPNARTADRI